MIKQNDMKARIEVDYQVEALDENGDIDYAAKKLRRVRVDRSATHVPVKGNRTQWSKSAHSSELLFEIDVDEIPELIAALAKQLMYHAI